MTTREWERTKLVTQCRSQANDSDQLSVLFEIHEGKLSIGFESLHIVINMQTTQAAPCIFVSFF